MDAASFASVRTVLEDRCLVEVRSMLFATLRSRFTLSSAAPQGAKEDSLLRKEVIQPLVPQRLPCYDFIPITTHTLGRQGRTSGADGFHDVTGGVYKARERIHGAEC